MFAFLSDFLQKKGIDTVGKLPLSACRITRAYLLERAGITDGTVFLFAIPYFTKACADTERNLSAYAVSRNYHLFFEELYGELLPALKNAFPENRFAGFSDHSPIVEVEAAARAGLGVIGQNHLLLTEKYSSYIFLGEIVTDAQIPCEVGTVGVCEGCGACQKKCPMESLGTCLSELTQRKGELNEEDAGAILRYGTVWGCDICQEVCPHTRRALREGTIFSPVPFFITQTISRLTLEILDSMSDEELATRAFGWRKRETIRRNLLIENAGKQAKGD